MSKPLNIKRKIIVDLPKPRDLSANRLSVFQRLGSKKKPTGETSNNTVQSTVEVKPIENILSKGPKLDEADSEILEKTRAVLHKELLIQHKMDSGKKQVRDFARRKKKLRSSSSSSSSSSGSGSSSDDSSSSSSTSKGSPHKSSKRRHRMSSDSSNDLKTKKNKLKHNYHKKQSSEAYNQKIAHSSCSKVRKHHTSSSSHHRHQSESPHPNKDSKHMLMMKERQREKERLLEMKRELQREREREHRERERVRVRERVHSRSPKPVQRFRSRSPHQPSRGRDVRRKTPERKISPRNRVEARSDRSLDRLGDRRGAPAPIRRHELSRERERERERRDRNSPRNKDRDDIIRTSSRTREHERQTSDQNRRLDHLDRNDNRSDHVKSENRLIPRPADRAIALAQARERSHDKSVDRDRKDTIPHEHLGRDREPDLHGSRYDDREIDRYERNNYPVVRRMENDIENVQHSGMRMERNDRRIERDSSTFYVKSDEHYNNRIRDDQTRIPPANDYQMNKNYGVHSERHRGDRQWEMEREPGIRQREHGNNYEPSHGERHVKRNDWDHNISSGNDVAMNQRREQGNNENMNWNDWNDTKNKSWQPEREMNTSWQKTDNNYRENRSDWHDSRNTGMGQERQDYTVTRRWNEWRNVQQKKIDQSNENMMFRRGGANQMQKEMGDERTPNINFRRQNQSYEMKSNFFNQHGTHNRVYHNPMKMHYINHNKNSGPTSTFTPHQHEFNKSTPIKSFEQTSTPISSQIKEVVETKSIEKEKKPDDIKPVVDVESSKLIEDIEADNLSEISDDADEILNQHEINKVEVADIKQFTEEDIASVKENNEDTKESQIQKKGDPTEYEDIHEEISDLDFEEISDGELEDESKCKGAGDALGVDWAGLVAETKVREAEQSNIVITSIKSKWQPHNILLDVGISLRIYGKENGTKLIKECLAKAKEETVALAQNNEVNKEVVENGNYNNDSKDKIKLEDGDDELINTTDIPDLPCMQLTKRNKLNWRKKLIMNATGKYSGALSARKDLQLRRQLFGLPNKEINSNCTTTSKVKTTYSSVAMQLLEKSMVKT